MDVLSIGIRSRAESFSSRTVLRFPMPLFLGATAFPEWLQAVMLGVGISHLKSVSKGCYDIVVIWMAVLIAIAVFMSPLKRKSFRGK